MEKIIGGFVMPEVEYASDIELSDDLLRDEDDDSMNVTQGSVHFPLDGQSNYEHDYAGNQRSNVQRGPDPQFPFPQKPLVAIWNGAKGPQLKVDNEATKYFLRKPMNCFYADIINYMNTYYFTGQKKKLWPKFNDNVTKKKTLWDQIANSMKDKGYLVPGKDPWKTCSQKWQNLMKAYKKYTLNETGSGADVLDNKPSFYDEIQDIIGMFVWQVSFTSNVE